VLQPGQEQVPGQVVERAEPARDDQPPVAEVDVAEMELWSCQDSCFVAGGRDCSRASEQSLLFVGVINLGILAALRGLIDGQTPDSAATDQARALQSAATAAVQRTAEELWPSNDEQAEQLAMVIGEVFGEPMTGTPPAGRATVLEALQAGIATQ
jgi:hypothetical protein